MIKSRISAYGESTFNGYDESVGMDVAAEATPSKLQAYIGTGNVDLTNYAQDSTETSVQLASGNLVANIIASHRGMIAIVNLGINDAYRGRSQSTFAANYNTALERLRRAGKLIHVQTPNAIGSGAAYFGHTNPADLINGYTFQNALAAMAAQIPSLAAGKGAACQGTGAQSVSLSGNVHPNAAGYDTMAAGLETLLPLSRVRFASSRLSTTLLYIAMFQRCPEKGGLDYWGDQILNGSLSYETGSCADVMLPFTPYATMNNTDFVTAIYNNVFGRAPDSGGLSYWVDQLSSHSRGYVLSTMMYIGYNYPDNGTDPVAIKSRKLIQNRASVGLAYGCIFQKTAVDSPSVLSAVTEDFATVTSTTASF